MCLKESLRLYPPVAVAFRTSSKPLNISGTTVPAGTEILLSFFATQRNEELWGADVLEFKPERFKDSPTPFSYLPFSAGNRKCGSPIVF
jgi:cytochrome P450 family 4